MSTLREKTKSKFLAVLEESYFSGANYSVAYPDGGEVELAVTFIPRPEFQFTFTRYSSTKYKTIEFPTEHLLAEDSYVRDDINECVQALCQWTQRIEEEYRTDHPVLDEFDSFRKSMEAKFRTHVEDEHSHFTKEQADALRSRLDDLANELAGLTERTTESERRLVQANADIEAMKADIDRLPRGIWFRKAGAKTVSILKSVVTSKEGRDFALAAAKKFLLEGPK